MPHQRRRRVANPVTCEDDADEHVEILAASARSASTEKRVEAAKPFDDVPPDREVRAGPEDTCGKGIKPRLVPVFGQVVPARLKGLAPRISRVEITLSRRIQRSSGHKARHAGGIGVQVESSDQRCWPRWVDDDIVV